MCGKKSVPAVDDKRRSSGEGSASAVETGLSPTAKELY